MSDKATTQGNAWVKSIVGALLTAAASWTAVSVEIHRTIDVKADALAYELRRDLGQVLHASVDSAFAALMDSSQAYAGRIIIRVDARLDSLPTPKPVVRTVVVAAAWDSVKMAELNEHIFDLHEALRMMAVERGRERNEHDEWRAALKKAHLLKGDTERKNGDGH